MSVRVISGGLVLLLIAEAGLANVGKSPTSPSLADLQFSELFITEMLVDGKKDNEFQYVISEEGVLCPKRREERAGDFRFFSPDLANSGCLDTRVFLSPEVQSARSSFASEKNAIRAVVNGKVEESGKRFDLEARRISEPGKPLILALTLYGKTLVTGLMNVWVEGRTDTELKLEREGARWRASARTEAAEWRGFTRILSHFEKPGFLGAGFRALFGGEGSLSRPFQAHAVRVEYR